MESFVTVLLSTVPDIYGLKRRMNVPWPSRKCTNYFCRGIDCFLGLSQFNFLIGKKIQPSVMDDGPKATVRGPTNTVEGEMVR